MTHYRMFDYAAEAVTFAMSVHDEANVTRVWTDRIDDNKSIRWIVYYQIKRPLTVKGI